MKTIGERDNECILILARAPLSKGAGILSRIVAS